MDSELDQVAAEVALLAAQAQLEVDALLSSGDLTDAAVAQIQQRFADAFVELMVAHLNVVPGSTDAWEARQVRAMPVGEISLSAALYKRQRETVAEVRAILAQHARGVQQARELALQLYDGYDPADGIRRPLEGSARATLPKALRMLTSDAADRASLTRLMEQGQRYAATLKTAPLRAAYAEALDAWQRGRGAEALRRKLDNAVREKNRFFANRIAQTELARAHQHALADELMADTTIGVVQVVLSGSHPRRDICDLHARADLFGLGPGCYPKAKAPRPTFHPYCRCRLRSRPDLNAADARARPRGDAAFLRAMPVDEAAQVMGSRAKLQRVLDGASAIDVVNRGVPEGYKTMRLGEVAQSGLVAQDAFEIAKAGGLHSGLIKRYGGETEYVVNKSIDSLHEQVRLHRAYIAAPLLKVDPGIGELAIQRLVHKKWPKEIERFQQEIEVLRGILRERT